VDLRFESRARHTPDKRMNQMDRSVDCRLGS
jgi:hypothetical protein